MNDATQEEDLERGCSAERCRLAALPAKHGLVRGPVGVLSDFRAPPGNRHVIGYRLIRQKAVATPERQSGDHWMATQ